MTPCQDIAWPTGVITEWGESNVVLIRECHTANGTLIRSYVPSAYDQMDVPDWGWGMHVGFTLCVLVAAAPLLLRRRP